MARAISLSLMGGVTAGTVLFAPFAADAQNASIDDLKTKIVNAQIMQRAAAKTLAHCAELNGANFYFQPRDRVLSLADYHRSLDSLAMARAFNPETKRPWSQQDADDRWTQAQKEAAQDVANCALIASLPELQKTLQTLLAAAPAPGGPTASTK